MATALIVLLGIVVTVLIESRARHIAGHDDVRQMADALVRQDRASRGFGPR